MEQVEKLLNEMQAQRLHSEKQLAFEKERYEAEVKRAADETDILKNEIKRLTKMVSNGNTTGDVGRSLFMDIAQRVPTFAFDQDSENCFTMWYDRYRTIFTVEASDLDENDRVRLLLER